jgi:hypothetical protein
MINKNERQAYVQATVTGSADEKVFESDWKSQTCLYPEIQDSVHHSLTAPSLYHHGCKNVTLPTPFCSKGKRLVSFSFNFKMN